MPTPAFRYHAYISHAPADDLEPGCAWASWVQHELETYEVPAEVAGRRTPAGTVPGSLSPVYRQPRDLGPDASLDPATREALEQSRTLIVICSPRAAASRHVAEEVRFFKQLGRERIFALIVAGDPEADDAHKSEQCYPDTLRHDVRRDGSLDREWRVHPAAADVRLEGTSAGFTTVAAIREDAVAAGVPAPKAEQRAAAYREKLDAARMKLIAGVLGVPVPELTRRGPAQEVAAAKRRTRFLWLIVLLFLAIAGASGWFAWRSLEQKYEAEDAKNRSDKLIAWMQRDLSEKLRAINQLLVLADANERVAQHFSMAAMRGDDPAALSLLADVLADSADIALARGNTAGAIEFGTQAVQTRERVAAMPAPPAGTDFRLVADHRRLAQTMLRANKKADALKQAIKARDLALDLVQTRTSDSEAQRQLVWAAYECGDLYAVTAGREEEAKLAFEQGLATAQKLAAADATNAQFQRDVAQGETRLGRLLQQRSIFDAALAKFGGAEKIIAPLAKTDPKDLALQSELAVIHGLKGGVLLVKQEYVAAAAEYRQAVEIHEQLAKSEPANLDRHFDHANSLRRLAESLLPAGPENKTEVLTLVQQALDIVARQFPDKGDLRAANLRTDLDRLRETALK